MMKRIHSSVSSQKQQPNDARDMAGGEIPALTLAEKSGNLGGWQ